MAESANQIEPIGIDSPHLATVKALWRQHSDTLGFFPDDAFNDYAHGRRILIATRDGRCVGYLLYRISKSKAVIAHFCVAPDARGQGVSHALINFLRGVAKAHRGIFLKCRKDFDLHSTWQHLGFTYNGESSGRAKSGSTLIHWWLDFGHPDLFDEESDSESLDAAIDANIFLDLMEERNEETLGLKADWLQESVTLCYTAELLNDVSRSDDGATRLKRRVEADQFKLLRCTPEAYQAAEAILKPLFPNLPTPQDESDFRHLVRASACGANVFVTRDRQLLDQSEAVFNACGLAIVRPAELIGQVDTLLQEKEYQRHFVAGTKQVSQVRISRLCEGLVASISDGQESRRELSATLNRFLADPKRYECHTLVDVDGEPLALYAMERRDGVIAIRLLRVPESRKSGTLTRYLLKGVIRRAVADDVSSVTLPESEITESIATACTSLGFLPIDGGKAKIVISGLLTSAEASERVTHRVEQLPRRLGTSRN